MDTAGRVPRRLRPHRLSTQLALLMALIVVAVVTVAVLNSSDAFKTDTLMGELKIQAEARANGTASAAAFYLVTNDRTGLETMLLKTARFPDVRRLAVVDPRGRVLAGVERDEDSLRSMVQPASLSVPGVKLARIETDAEPGLRNLLGDEVPSVTVWSPIDTGSLLGWVKADFSMKRALDAQAQRVRNHVALSTLAALLTALVVWAFVRRTVRQLESAAAFAECLDTRRGERLHLPHSSREVAALDQALNRVSERLYQQERALEGLNAHLHALLRQAADGIITLGEHRRILSMNAAAERIFSIEATDVVGLHVSVLLPEDPIDDKAGGDGGRFQVSGRRGDGRPFPLEISVSEVVTRDAHEFIVILRDITERLRAEEALRRSESNLSVAQRLAHVGSWEWNVVENEMLWSDELYRIFGLAPRKAESMPIGLFQGLVHVEDRPVLMHALQTALSEGKPYDMEYRIRPCNGEDRTVRARGEVERDASGRVVKVFGTVQDVTEARRAEERIRQMAHYDALTGLPNRVLMQDRLLHALSLARRNETLAAVMFVDLDRFKHVNDSLGHDVGDLLLQAVARRLAGCVRETDTVARQGGDEFVVILPCIGEIDDARLVAHKVIEAVGAPFMVGKHQLHVSPSIGIAVYPYHGYDVQDLMKSADIAMYHAKEAGRNTYRVYQVEMNTREYQRVVMDNELRDALSRNEFHLVYQPQFDLASGCIVGVEALLRWRHPVRGEVLPLEFLPWAEESGLVLPIGEWVMRTACAQQRAWMDAGLPGVRVAVNLSARQFHSETLLEVVESALAITGLDPEWLELELTENIMLDNEEATVRTLRRAACMGLHITLDDFGKGYSSLNHLKRYPVSKLKIGGNFVGELPGSADDYSIVCAVLALGRSFHLQVVAEAVETEAQLSVLRSLECGQAQGNLLCPPLAPEAFAARLRDGELRAAARAVA